MDFAEKYELLNPLPGDGVRSYRARQVENGREVTAHLLPGGKNSPETKELMARLLKLPPASMAKLLVVGEYQGASFVVIDSPPHLHLLDWFRVEEGGTAEPGVGANVRLGTKSPAPQNSAPGEFTRLFQTGGLTKGAPPRETSGDTSGMFPAVSSNQNFPGAPVSQEPSQKPAEPGEFTRLFRTNGQTGTNRSGSRPADPPAASSPPIPANSPACFKASLPRARCPSPRRVRPELFRASPRNPLAWTE